MKRTVESSKSVALLLESVLFNHSHSVVSSPSRPALTLFHNLQVDVVDVGASMSTMSAEFFADHVLQKWSCLAYTPNGVSLIELSA